MTPEEAAAQDQLRAHELARRLMAIFAKEPEITPKVVAMTITLLIATMLNGERTVGGADNAAIDAALEGLTRSVKHLLSMMPSTEIPNA